MKQPLPPTYFSLWIVLALALHFWLPLRALVPAPDRYAGVLLILLGFWLNIAADRLFKIGGTTVKPFETPSALITSGPFCISRNPMYLGMVTALLGFAIMLGTLAPLAIPPLLFLILHYRFVLPEERSMAAAFGDSFLDYRRRVRRWI